MGAVEAYTAILESLGLAQYCDPGTAERHVRAIGEMTDGASSDPSEHLEVRFPAVQKTESLTIVSNLPFVSMCAHHMLPFWGKAHIGFIQPPDRELVGLSKIGRCLKGYAHRPQTQEQIMQNMIDALEKRLGTTGVGIIITATHSCMALRGLNSGSASGMTTQQMSGRMVDSQWGASFLQALIMDD